jgi:hypothetical protein
MKAQLLVPYFFFKFILFLKISLCKKMINLSIFLITTTSPTIFTSFAVFGKVFYIPSTKFMLKKKFFTI